MFSWANEISKDCMSHFVLLILLLGYKKRFEIKAGLF